MNLLWVCLRNRQITKYSVQLENTKSSYKFCTGKKLSCVASGGKAVSEISIDAGMTGSVVPNYSLRFVYNSLRRSSCFTLGGDQRHSISLEQNSKTMKIFNGCHTLEQLQVQKLYWARDLLNNSAAIGRRGAARAITKEQTYAAL